MPFQPPPSREQIDLSGLETPKLDFERFEEFETYRQAIDRFAPAHEYEAAFSQFLAACERPPRLFGWCDVCQSDNEFRLPNGASWQAFRREPNWRESLQCGSCQLICRLRASVHAFKLSAKGRAVDGIYLTERLSPLYDWFDQSHANVVGSEFFGDDSMPGKTYFMGRHRVRHEDLTALSFEPESFTDILTFDVLEHVPDVESSIREMYRVLKPDGRLMISVPFDLMSETTLTRARLGEDGEIEHLEPPEYHGDPVAPGDGILCFYRFGWDLLEQLRVAGFVDVALLQYWVPARGYMGWAQNLIIATRPDA